MIGRFAAGQRLAGPPVLVASPWPGTRDARARPHRPLARSTATGYRVHMVTTPTPTPTFAEYLAARTIVNAYLAQNTTPLPYRCTVCAHRFTATRPAKTCSATCRSALRRQRGRPDAAPHRAPLSR